MTAASKKQACRPIDPWAFEPGRSVVEIAIRRRIQAAKFLLPAQKRKLLAPAPITKLRKP